MRVPLSKRLLACCNYVCPGDRVADVGTDHGYLGIWLLQHNIASSVIASDIVPGPLSSAKQNARKYGVSDKMEFYISNGLQEIPRDFNTMVCAGMGADTMISILDAAPWLKSADYRLILQCQSKTPTLRRYLSDHGYRIYEETVLRDGKFLYTVMEVSYCPGYTLTPAQQYFPPALLENPATALPEYYQSVLMRLQRALRGQKDHPDPSMVTALQELESLTTDPAFYFLKEDLP